MDTPVNFLYEENGCRFYIKRDDLLPFCFGGNKARIAERYFEAIDRGRYDCVVTYGTASSNLCRTVAWMAARRGMRCIVITPEERQKTSFNSRMTEQLGAERILCPVKNVAAVIEDTVERLRKEGQSPFFIPGGGSGPIGTEAYVRCYDEILRYEAENGLFFDNIFFASGTGTTQAGLVCGMLLRGGRRNIVGISIARKNPRGREAVLKNVREYLDEKEIWFGEDETERAVVFDDRYIGGGYGAGENGNIGRFFREYGIALDPVYTGKAFDGMERYVAANGISGNILFIHTGGIPLFFDALAE